MKYCKFLQMSNQFQIKYGGFKKIHNIIYKVCKTKNLDSLRKRLTQQNTNVYDNYGNTPALIAIRHGAEIPILELLSEFGADFSLQNFEGYDCLVCAIIYNTDIVNWLLSNYTFNHNYNIKGYSLLEIVAMSNINNLELILQHQDCSQEEKDKTLHFLCKQNLDCKILLQYGTDANSKINDTYPMSYCLKAYNTWTKDIVLRNIFSLLEYGASFFPHDYRHLKDLRYFDYDSLYGGSIKDLFSTLNIEFDVNQKDHTGKNYILYHCDYPYILITSFDTSIDINVSDNDGNTPLHLLVKNYNTFGIKSFLINHKPYIVTNNNGETPFFQLIYKYNTEHIHIDETLIELLLNYGADIYEAYKINPLKPELKFIIDTLAEKYGAMIKEPEE